MKHGCASKSFLETRAASTAAASLPAEVDREELLRFAGYWARRQLARLAPYKLSSLEQEDQGAIRGFYGWRAWHEHVKDTLLNHISQLWIGYLTRIEDLQQGIGLEAFGQRDPLIEYKRRAFEMFDELLATMSPQRRGGSVPVNWNCPDVFVTLCVEIKSNTDSRLQCLAASGGIVGLGCFAERRNQPCPVTIWLHV